MIYYLHHHWCQDQDVALSGLTRAETICILGKTVTLRYSWVTNKKFQWGLPNNCEYKHTLSFVETVAKLKCLLSHNVFFHSVDGLEEILETLYTIRCLNDLKPSGIDFTFDIFEGRPSDETELDEGGVNLLSRQLNISRWLVYFAVNSDDVEARVAALSFSKDNLEDEIIEKL